MPDWNPLDKATLSAIRAEFQAVFPVSGYATLADDIARYWIDMLQRVWRDKPERIRQKDLNFDPADPLSRIAPHTMVIAYADSVRQEDARTLDTLDRFLGEVFPSVRGLHLLPACRIVEDRFNDGYFSQIERNRVHPRFGTNRRFADLVEKYFSMADFVLNHVDIENPEFRAYLDGDDAAGECFYVFSEPDYRRRMADGDFDRIFRPRPFPLFSIFRRRPIAPEYAQMPFAARCAAVNDRIDTVSLPEPVIGIFSVFDKILNDQMLLAADYTHLERFREYLETRGTDPESIFTLSETQETRHPPYIFKAPIAFRSDLLAAIGYARDAARRIATAYEELDPVVFGEPVRAMTTFSHVQVDVNTSTWAGLKMLADDFAWYLGLDLNLLRLDAANYAFKKWKTSCFGLPEVHRLMRILYLSMEAVSPRTVANLEVNDTLGTILSRMADRSAPPPMMYDFHLACVLPAVFNTGKTDALCRIPRKIAEYDIPKTSIRFSVAESHDGKSVRGSLDILTLSERQALAETVEANGGRVKYKAVPAGTIEAETFDRICREAGINNVFAIRELFRNAGAAGEPLVLKEKIRSVRALADALGIPMDAAHRNPPLRFLSDRVIHGREPYELCVSTRDALARIGDPDLEAARYLAFYTLAFAMMGRNVKSIYFNDLMGLPNDYDRMARTGELRDIKRTRSRFEELVAAVSNNDSIHYAIAHGIDRLIAIVDTDPAFGPHGSEPEIPATHDPSVAVIINRCRDHQSRIIVNTMPEKRTTVIDPQEGKTRTRWVERFGGTTVDFAEKALEITLAPFERLWLTRLP